MNTDNKTSTVPLYKELKSRITPGEWIPTQEFHLKETHPINENQIFITTDDLETIAILETSEFSSIQQNEANAEYTALAVNNLHHIAEALKEMIQYLEWREDFAIEDADEGNENVYTKAKEALKRIS